MLTRLSAPSPKQLGQEIEHKTGIPASCIFLKNSFQYIKGTTKGRTQTAAAEPVFPLLSFKLEQQRSPAGTEKHTAYNGPSTWSSATDSQLPGFDSTACTRTLFTSTEKVRPTFTLHLIKLT